MRCVCLRPLSWNAFNKMDSVCDLQEADILLKTAGYHNRAVFKVLCYRKVDFYHSEERVALRVDNPTTPQIYFKSIFGTLMCANKQAK